MVHRFQRQETITLFRRSKLRFTGHMKKCFRRGQHYCTVYRSGSHPLRAGHAPAYTSYQEVNVKCTSLGEGRHPPTSRAPRSRGLLHRDGGRAPCTMCLAGCRAWRADQETIGRYLSTVARAIIKAVEGGTPAHFYCSYR